MGLIADLAEGGKAVGVLGRSVGSQESRVWVGRGGGVPGQHGRVRKWRRG